VDDEFAWSATREQICSLVREFTSFTRGRETAPARPSAGELSAMLGSLHSPPDFDDPFFKTLGTQERRHILASPSEAFELE
jgi:hypothetical protein